MAKPITRVDNATTWISQILEHCRVLPCGGFRTILLLAFEVQVVSLRKTTDGVRVARVRASAAPTPVDPRVLELSAPDAAQTCIQVLSTGLITLHPVFPNIFSCGKNGFLMRPNMVFGVFRDHFQGLDMDIRGLGFEIYVLVLCGNHGI